MKTITRREVFKTVGLAAAGLFVPKSVFTVQKTESSKFEYCINSSTLRGQNPGLLKFIEISARAGYDSVELWISDIKKYIGAGNSLISLKKFIDDNKIGVANAIGFAPWMAEDDQMRKAGFVQMEEEMNIMAGLGCTRIAAPAAGVKNDKPLDLNKAGESYRQLLELGRKTGVMPQLEFWGASKAFYNFGQSLHVLAAANDPDGRLLADVYHLFRGGSGFNGLKMINGKVIEIFHMNDYVASIPREQQADKDRVYPGDGVAPMLQILTDLKNMGGKKILSLELFNIEYWKQDPMLVAKTGIDKMQKLVRLTESS
jgi:2-keto-myo-inositol isomerase